MNPKKRSKASGRFEGGAETQIVCWEYISMDILGVWDGRRQEWMDVFQEIL